MKTIILVTIALVFMGCATSNIRNNGKPRETNLTSFIEVDRDIYILGMTAVGMQGVTCYWKNGELVKLPNSYGAPTAIAIQGNDVYILGMTAVGMQGVACYWKNGELVKLPNSYGA